MGRRRRRRKLDVSASAGGGSRTTPETIPTGPPPPPGPAEPPQAPGSKRPRGDGDGGLTLGDRTNQFLENVQSGAKRVKDTAEHIGGAINSVANAAGQAGLAYMGGRAIANGANNVVPNNQRIEL